MSLRPEERRAAAAYDRRLRGRTFARAAQRAFIALPATYLLNTPALDLSRAVGLQPGHRVLELGCGDGSLLRLIAERAGLRHDPVGVDLSRRALRLAARRRGGDRRVELVASGASRLPFADESFHLVLAAHLFRQLEDETLYRTLLEAHRVLKPGGILLGWEFAPTSSRRLNRLHTWLLTRRVDTCRLRGYGLLATYALDIGFRHADRQRFRLPFLFPPIPRVAVMLQKARAGAPPQPAEESCLAERTSREPE